MRVGVHFMNFTLPGEPQSLARLVGDTAVAAEEAGCAWFTVMDHWFQMEAFAPATDPMLEAYTTLGFVAAKTSTIQLGTLVTGVTYRHPGLLAKIVTTLDVLSEGRAMLGIGAAWYEREHLALGVPYPALSERFERLEETLQIARQMWSDDDGPFDAEHYHLAETINSPRAVSTPRPKIMVGGSGEKKTLRLVAQYADICNLFAATPEDAQHKIDVLKGHCDAVGRDFSEIEVTIMGGGVGVNAYEDPDGFVTAMEPYAKLGVHHVQIANAAPDPVAAARALGAVVPRLAELG